MNDERFPYPKPGNTSRGALTLALGQAAGFILGMAGSAFLARLLGPAQRGTFELLVLFPNLAVLLLRAGVSTGAIYHAGADTARRKELSAQALGLTILLGIIGAVLGVTTAAAMTTLPVPRALLVGSFAVFPFFLWVSNARELLNGLGRFTSTAVSVVTERGFLTLLLALAFIVGITELTPLYTLYLVSVVSVATLLWIQLGIPPRLDTGDSSRRLLSYGLRASLAPLLFFMHLRADQFVLGVMTPGASLGWYVVAMSVSEIFLPLPDAIYSALYPRLMRADNAGRAALAARAARLSTVGLVGISVIVAAVAAPVIRLLFGTAFIPALAFIPFLIPARVFVSCSYVLRSTLLAEGRPLEASALTACGLVVNVIGLIVWMPAHGALGAAWAAALSCSTEYALTLWAASRRLGCSPLALVIPRRGDLAGLMPR